MILIVGSANITQILNEQNIPNLVDHVLWFDQLKFDPEPKQVKKNIESNILPKKGRKN